MEITILHHLGVQMVLMVLIEGYFPEISRQKKQPSSYPYSRPFRYIPRNIMFGIYMDVSENSGTPKTPQNDHF